MPSGGFYGFGHFSDPCGISDLRERLHAILPDASGARKQRQEGVLAGRLQVALGWPTGGLVCDTRNRGTLCRSKQLRVLGLGPPAGQRLPPAWLVVPTFRERRRRPIWSARACLGVLATLRRPRFPQPTESAAVGPGPRAPNRATFARRTARSKAAPADHASGAGIQTASRAHAARERADRAGDRSVPQAPH